MFEQATLREPRNVLGDWILRGGIAVLFVLFGAEKFPSGPGAPWVGLFQQIGAGQWFRYFTGVVEVLGGVLVLIPWTVTAGLALLAATMAGAVVILVFVIGRPQDCVFAGLLLVALTAFGWTRRRGA
jgi:putative oxidoreductase